MPPVCQRLAATESRQAGRKAGRQTGRQALKGKK